MIDVEPSGYVTPSRMTRTTRGLVLEHLGRRGATDLDLVVFLYQQFLIMIMYELFSLTHYYILIGFFICNYLLYFIFYMVALI
jgi:hypothetical protein